MPSHFRFNVLCLVYFHIFKSFCLKGISFLMYANFSGTQLEHKRRFWCVLCYIFIPSNPCIQNKAFIMYSFFCCFQLKGIFYVFYDFKYELRMLKTHSNTLYRGQEGNNYHHLPIFESHSFHTLLDTSFGSAPILEF